MIKQPTIAAIATPSGRGGVGVIRISGPNALWCGEQLCHQALLQSRYAYFRQLYDDQGQVLDEGLIVYFKAPHSFTGEDVVEVQGHGSPVAQAAILERLYGLGAKAAGPGEFSARAFENGKLDLVQAEAIADLIAATSQAAARSAVRSLQGEFSRRIQELLTRLIEVRLHVEAAIDFPEEEIDFLGDGRILTLIDKVIGAITEVQQSARQGQLLREGIEVAIAGRPNAGKSSLLNALAGVDRAIVTPVAGTTRDVLQERITLRGLPLTIADTAGLRAAEDLVEQEGIRRAKQVIAQADLILAVYDHTQDTPDTVSLWLEGVDANRVIWVANKADLKTTIEPSVASSDHVHVSAQTGAGLDVLIDRLVARAGFRPQEGTFIARTRHLDALRRCIGEVQQARVQLVEHRAGELVAESLRRAQQALSEITGEFSADDLLGKIFGSFCIGK